MSEDSKRSATSTEAAGKKVYVPPRLTSIKLRPEEAVLGACKTASVAGASASLCRLCGAQIAT